MEAQKEVIVSLRRFETIHTLRREKLREFLILRRLVNQASQMLVEMRNYFPHVEGRVAKMVEKEDIKPEQRSVLNASDEAELHRLDRELGEIERKLKEL